MDGTKEILGLWIEHSELADAREIIETWRVDYNTERPYSALAGSTPAEAYGTDRRVDMMDNADGLPTSPQAQQPLQDVVTRTLAV